MSRSQRGGGFGALSPTRTYRGQQSAPSVGGFSTLLAQPARGAFVMPADAVLALYAAGGYSAYEMVTLTAPDGSVRTINSPGMNPGARSVINGVVSAGTRVEPGYGLDVQVQVAPLEWRTIAVS
jgi:hypothetical protein